MKTKVRALNIKSGPTESGTISSHANPVGGTTIPIDKISILLSNFWPLIILMLLPLAFILYKKRSLALRLLTPMISRML